MFSGFFLKNKSGEGKSFAWTVASGIAYSLGSFIFLAVVTQVLNERSGNVLSIGLMVAQQILTISRFSVRNYQVSDVNHRYSFSDYFVFRIFTSVLSVIVMAVWIFVKGYTGETAIVVVCMSVYKIADALSDLYEGLYQQQGRLDVSGKSQFIKNLILDITFLAAIIISRNMVISSVIIAVLSMLLILVIDVPLSRHFEKTKFKIDFKIIGKLFVACFALFAASFLYVYINNEPKYALEAISTEADTYLVDFSAIFMPVFAVDLLAGMTMRLWLKKMSEYHNEGNYAGFRKLVFKQVLIVFAITVFCTGFMFVWGSPILGFIYHLDLSQYDLSNAILMLAGGLVAVCTLFENIVVIYRKQHFSIIINILSAVAAFVIVPLCVSKDGVKGACTGYLIVNAIRTLGYFGNVLVLMIKDKKSILK